MPPQLERAKKPLIVGLIASPERIVQIRQNRLLALNATRRQPLCGPHGGGGGGDFSRKLCARHNWPIIDVTRRSIEETAAAIIDLYKRHRMQFIVD